jgi:hypothetical protein
VSEQSALVLATDALLRFVPVENFNGAPGSLGVYALDDTYGGDVTTETAPVTIDVTVRGGSTAISAVEADFRTEITPVNDAPVANEDAINPGITGGEIAIFGFADDGTETQVLQEPQGLGRFTSIKLLDGTESLAALTSYSAILVYQNHGGYFPQFGNTLADYVDAGGHLVAATFLWQGGDHGRLDQGYLPFDSYFGNYSTSTLGSFDIGSPIMAASTN